MYACLYFLAGPYFPRIEVEVVERVFANHVTQNMALCIKALKDHTDRDGVARICGDKWLVTKPGLYLPGVFEEVVETRHPQQLTDKVCENLIIEKTYQTFCWLFEGGLFGILFGFYEFFVPF